MHDDIMRTIAAAGNKFGLSAGQFACLVACASVSFVVCCAFLLPAVQDSLLMLGDLLVQRPLVRPKWHGRFFAIGAFGILLHCVFFFLMFFYQEGLRKENTDARAHIFVVVFALACVCIIMFRANWTFGDDWEYLTTTAVGKYVSPSFITNMGIGRFYPLGHIHYNIPLFFFRLFGQESGLPVEAHFATIAVCYVATILCLYVLFIKIEPVEYVRHKILTAAAACAFVLSKTFSDIYMRLVYAETQVVMLFSVFLLMYYMALETDNIKYYIMAGITAVYASYCKEPVFGVFWIIAVTNCLFKFNIASKKERCFYTALIVNGIIFLVAYYFLSFKTSPSFYNQLAIDRTGWKFFAYLFGGNPVLLLGFFVCSIRIFYILIKKERCMLYYDSTLFAGIGYIFAYMVLKLDAYYLFAPAIVLFLPSFVWWAKYLYQKKRNYFLLYCYIIMVMCTYNGIFLSSVRENLYERKICTTYFTSLLEKYNQGNIFIWYESDNRLNMNNVYVAARGWRKVFANALLNYLRKTEVHDFFTLQKDMHQIDFRKKFLFFYPVDNDQYQPMAEVLATKLAENHFTLDAVICDISVYMRQ